MNGSHIFANICNKVGHECEVKQARKQTGQDKQVWTTKQNSDAIQTTKETEQTNQNKQPYTHNSEYGLEVDKLKWNMVGSSKKTQRKMNHDGRKKLS